MKTIQLSENGLSLAVTVDEKGIARLAYFGQERHLPATPFSEDKSHFAFSSDSARYHLVSIQADKNGVRHYQAMGGKQHLASPGIDFVYREHREVRNEHGRKFEIDLNCDFLAVTVHWQFFTDIPLLRAWLDIRNEGTHSRGLEQAASFFSHGISRTGQKSWNEKSRVYFCRNSWCDELRWEARDLGDLGVELTRELSSSRLRIGTSGTWSTKEYLPLGLYENTEAGETMFWQIESSGSWSWEIGNSSDHLYLLAQGPNEIDGHWCRQLQSGETFETVPVAVGIVEGGFNEALGALTDYRRRIRHPHWDNEQLPIIFNDYMNCLGADPTTEKELPYIHAAGEIGTEIYVIDAGWYAQQGEDWWTTVGQWQPSTDRFDGGIISILQTIRDHGMIPGLWLELEVMGVNCPLAPTWPPECFFRRHNQPIVCRGRYQLDFRHEQVIAHADEVIDRLAGQYGVGYIKMDYNIDAGLGTEVGADSFGDGLLQHNRAYLAWLDRVLQRYPRLIIENCSSGGLRMDYALLSRHSLQSISDQPEVTKLARIAVMGASGATPEQQAVWVYPKREEGRELVIMNCVNALLQRFHLSGELAYLTPENRDLVKEALELYRQIRGIIPQGRPFWPLGLLGRESEIAAYGIRYDRGLLLAVWNFSESERKFNVPIPEFTGFKTSRLYYPECEAETVWSFKNSHVSIRLPPGPCARMLALSRG